MNISFEAWLAQRRLRFTLLLMVIAVGLASLYMMQDYRQLVVGGVAAPSLAKVAWQRYVIWFLWALLTPAIIIVGSRIRTGRLRGAAGVPAWIALGLASGFAHSAMFAPITHAIPSMALAKPAANVWEAISQRAGMSYAANLLVFTAIALAYLVVASAYDVRQREREAAQLEAKLARSELELLKMQLQPHFVFNTLQTASALIEYNVADARRVLATLGSLLRFSLDNLGTSEITLNEEVAVLQQYLDIQHARFKERLRVRIEVDASAESVLVPALLLQPIVENAIRHGVEQRSRGGSIVVHAARASGRLTIAVTDDGPGLKPEAFWREAKGNGVGLANVRARLKQLYGDAARLDLANGAAGGCELTVEMPAREAGNGVAE